MDGREIGEEVRFTIGLPHWTVLRRLRGGHPLVRKTDRVEALVLVLAVLVSVLVIPVALAVVTVVHDMAGSVLPALLAGGLLWLGVTGSAAGVFLVTRSVCNGIRSAGWESELDDLADHGGTGRGLLG
ncbi:hypothetical protein [Mycolicibacterium phlei]|jgi:prepilin signal peptidase PulO-like enzyme (type II secretory pathway)